MVSTPHRAAALAVDTLCGVVGRRQAVRAARFALRRARLDLPNSPYLNGEYALQRWMLRTAAPDQPFTAFDVGANIGEWSLALLRQAAQAGRSEPPRIHAFEPAGATFAMLCQRVPPEVRSNRLALSDDAGERPMFIVGPGAGRNSLHPTDGLAAVTATERVATGTIDEYVRTAGVERIDLLKIDTEGHDFAVLSGAGGCLAAQRISVVQFEYNHRWVYPRRFLKDVFDLAQPHGYRVGKLTPRGVEGYPGWDPDLETFIEGNYVLCTEEAAERLPRVAWWKSGRR
ncbi:FkbM family methyltransferase [Plantactinospora siamensis]|uniref:FkbM family methyltransferase n=1 Tax=Plantactinospora siamensis TaxID=555372 RepID=A0ABV6P0U3_9ACTN